MGGRAWPQARRPQAVSRQILTGLGKRTINVTDRDSGVIARETRQPVQGYNAQAVATSEQIIVAADITQQSNDSGQLEPMIRQAVETLSAAGCREQVGTVLADGGYWNQRTSSRLVSEGMQMIVPPDRYPEPTPGNCPRNRDQRPSASTGCWKRPMRPRALQAPPAHDRDGLREH